MENYEQYSSFVAAHKTSLAARRYALFKPPEPSFVPPKYRITIHIVFVKPSFRIVVNMGNPAVPDGSPSSEERSTSSPCSLLPKPMNAKQQCLDLRFFFLDFIKKQASVFEICTMSSDSNETTLFDYNILTCECFPLLQSFEASS
mmetsp:Transcript_6769/g.8240  ORF Transcript_6769/g.8240 Transcript_6769/m.8240 type:complete len:145 (-) Transcript_6769:329-763(-)